MRPSATLIVGPSWVGDMVIAQALFKRMKAEMPERALDVLAPAWSLPIVARMPEIRRGIASQTGHGEVGLGKRRQIAATLRDEGYEHAIVLPRSFKAALIPWFAGIARRTGYRGESRFFIINDTRPFDKAMLDQTVKRFVALGGSDGSTFDSLPEPALAVSRAHQSRLLRELCAHDGETGGRDDAGRRIRAGQVLAARTFRRTRAHARPAQATRSGCSAPRRCGGRCGYRGASRAQNLLWKNLP